MARKKDPNAPKWEQLSCKLLTAQGRKLVSADPDLSPETLEALQVVEAPIMVGGMAATHPWFLDPERDGSDISASLIASCINDNVHACMAELVARYAEVRYMTFCEAACKLCQLRDAGKLFRWSSSYPYAHLKWTPSAYVKAKMAKDRRKKEEASKPTVTFTTPPKKRTHPKET